MTTPSLTWPRGLRSFAFLFPLVIGASAPCQVAAKSADPVPLRFEVASIRPHKSAGDEPSDRRMLPGGRFVASATSVRALILIAFGTDANRVSGAPGWIDSETFDIDATTVDHVDVTTPQQFQQVMLALLEDRFQFKFHRESKEGPVYWLELEKPGKPGPGLMPSTPASEPNMSSSSNAAVAKMSASKMSMADFAAALRRQTGRPVEDHTDLKGYFDFKIEWAPDGSSDSTYPGLFTVLKEQLGMKLQSAKGTTEMFVVDQISHPSAN